MKTYIAKFGKYALITGIAAALPEVTAALSNAGTLTGVDWTATFDRAGATFLSAAIGGLIGATQSVVRSRKKDG